METEEFERLYKLSQEIQGNMSLIEMFCKKFEEIEDFYKIVPLLNRTKKLSDELYNEFINGMS